MVNGSTLPVTSVGDLVLLGPFYLNNIFIAPNMIQNLLSVRQFTTANSWNLTLWLVCEGSCFQEHSRQVQ